MNYQNLFEFLIPINLTWGFRCHPKHNKPNGRFALRFVGSFLVLLCGFVSCQNPKIELVKIDIICTDEKEIPVEGAFISINDTQLGYTDRNGSRQITVPKSTKEWSLSIEKIGFIKETQSIVCDESKKIEVKLQREMFLLVFCYSIDTSDTKKTVPIENASITIDQVEEAVLTGKNGIAGVVFNTGKDTLKVSASLSGFQKAETEIQLFPTQDQYRLDLLMVRDSEKQTPPLQTAEPTTSATPTPTIKALRTVIPADTQLPQINTPKIVTTPTSKPDTPLSEPVVIATPTVKQAPQPKPTVNVLPTIQALPTEEPRGSTSVDCEKFGNEQVDKIIRIAQTYEKFQDDQANIKLAVAKYEEIINAFDKGCKIDGLKLNQVANRLADRYMDENRNDDAIVVLKKAIDYDQRYPICHYMLGLAQKNKGSYQQAYESFNRAIDLISRYPEQFEKSADRNLIKIYCSYYKGLVAEKNFQAGSGSREDAISAYQDFLDRFKMKACSEIQKEVIGSLYNIETGTQSDLDICELERNISDRVKQLISERGLK